MLKMIYSFLALLICLIPGSVFAEKAPSAITMGIIAGGNPAATKVDAKNLAELLQKKLNTAVNVYISKDYSSLAAAIKDRKVDYAFMTALSYVKAENDVQMKVLLKKTWSGPYYYSALVTLNKKIKNITQIKNKKIAFVDPQSTSGYLYPKVYLSKKHIADESFAKVIFSGSHAASIAMLENGEVDVAAVFSDDDKSKTGAWTRFGKQSEKMFKVLWTSDPIPNDPIIVRSDFYDQYPKFTHDFMYELIELQSDTDLRSKISEVMGKGELMPATSKQYDPVRDMSKTLKK